MSSREQFATQCSGHGLFFISFVSVNSTTNTASFLSGFGQTVQLTTGNEVAISFRSPARYDRFLADNAGVSLIDYCPDEGRFYNVVTSSGLRFVDTAASQSTNFAMFSPNPNIPLSSISHFVENAAALASDCTLNGLNPTDKVQCSSLMTPSLRPGDFENNIGENTLRVMRAIMGSTPGFAGACKFNPFVNNF